MHQFNSDAADLSLTAALRLMISYVTRTSPLCVCVCVFWCSWPDSSLMVVCDGVLTAG